MLAPGKKGMPLTRAKIVGPVPAVVVVVVLLAGVVVVVVSVALVEFVGLVLGLSVEKLICACEIFPCQNKFYFDFSEHYLQLYGKACLYNGRVLYQYRSA